MTKADQLSAIAQQIEHCKYCNSQKNGRLVPGEGPANAKLVFVGEAPGKEEVKTGRPFIGRSGQVLRSLITSLGITPEGVFITSAVKYLPSYVTPKLPDIEHGRDHLFAQLDVIRPKLVVLLGASAMWSVLGEKKPLLELKGKIIERDSRQYFLTLHPAAQLYNPNLRSAAAADFVTLKKYL